MVDIATNNCDFPVRSYLIVSSISFERWFKVEHVRANKFAPTGILFMQKQFGGGTLGDLY